MARYDEEPREYRHRPGWLLLAVAVVVLAWGVAAGQGLLIASGLVLAGAAAGQLFGWGGGHRGDLDEH